MQSETVAMGHIYQSQLRGLFNDFRLAHLNQRYYSERLENLRKLNTFFSTVVMVTSAASFAVLSFAKFPGVNTVAAILAVTAFLASVCVPILNLGQKMEDAAARSYAFHYAAQQLECAISFVKSADDESKEGEVKGWVSSAGVAYNQATALRDVESPNQKLRKKLRDEINASYPPNYVWTAF